MKPHEEFIKDFEEELEILKSDHYNNLETRKSWIFRINELINKYFNTPDSIRVAENPKQESVTRRKAHKQELGEEMSPVEDFYNEFILNYQCNEDRKLFLELYDKYFNNPKQETNPKKLGIAYNDGEKSRLSKDKTPAEDLTKECINLLPCQIREINNILRELGE